MKIISNSGFLSTNLVNGDPIDMETSGVPVSHASRKALAGFLLSSGWLQGLCCSQSIVLMISSLYLA